MEENNTNFNRIKELLIKLKKAHGYYVVVNEEQKGKIFDNCQYILDELESLGCQRVFCESLLLYGKEFLDYEYVKKK